MKIFVIGSGNVATQLGLALKREGNTIVAVCSRKNRNAKALAVKLRSIHGTDLRAMCKNPDLNADVYLIAVNDDNISAVVGKLLAPKNALVVHTSGATDISVLKKKFPRCGVIWQAQTIKKHSRADFKKIPLILEASNASALNKLKSLVRRLSPKIYVYNSKQRRLLHLAAVWINNFPNHLFVLAKELLKKNRLPYDLFAPLILTTAQNGIQDPVGAQTGPARRNDQKTLNAHLKLLSDKKYRTLYRTLSTSIYQHEKK